MTMRSISAHARLNAMLAATIERGILVRAGETITPELARERANNLAQQVVETIYEWEDDPTEPMRPAPAPWSAR